MGKNNIQFLMSDYTSFLPSYLCNPLNSEYWHISFKDQMLLSDDYRIPNSLPMTHTHYTAPMEIIDNLIQ